MAIETSERDEFAVITLNRPEALNALSFSLIGDLNEALDQVASGSHRALIITGAGDRAFCAGADVTELMGRDQAETKRTTDRGQRTFARLGAFPIPSVAVINGFAFGGGLELATACTFRLATPNAKLGTPEIKLGIIPGYGATQRLPRLVGEARALEMVMTGRTVEAEEAERIGLINRIVEGDPIEAGVEFAREFSGYRLPVLNMAREAVLRALDVPLSEGLKIEADLSTLSFQTADGIEGMNAFVEKRKPTFQDA